MIAINDPLGILEVARTVGIAALVGGVSRLLRDMRGVRKDLGQQTESLTKLYHIVVGPEGNNGMRSKLTALGEDVEEIQKRNQRIDAITEYEEKHRPPGEDRRQSARRARDLVRDIEEEEKRR